MKNWNRDCGWISLGKILTFLDPSDKAQLLRIICSHRIFDFPEFLSLVVEWHHIYSISGLSNFFCDTTKNWEKLQLRILTSEKKFPYQIFNEPSWLPETLIFFGKIDVTTFELNFKLSFMFLIELCRNFWKRAIWIYNSNSGNVIFFGRNVMPICDNTVMDLVLWIWIHKWNIHSIFIKSSIYLSATSRLENTKSGKFQ